MKVFIRFILLLFIFPVMANVESDLAKIDQQILAVEQTIEKQRERSGSLQQQLKNSETAIGKINTSLRDLDRKKQRQESQLANLEKDLTIQEKALKEQSDALVSQIRATYAIGSESSLKVLLKQGDPTLVNRLLTYHHYLYRTRLADIAKVKNSLNLVAEKKQVITEEQIKLIALEKLSIQEKNQLIKQTGERKQILGKLSKEISVKEQELDKLREDQRALTQLIRKIELDRKIAVSSSEAFSTLKGKLIKPIKTAIKQKFGSKLGNSELTSTGVVFNAKEGDWVNAVAPGKIVFADWLRGFGLLIIIEHNNGYMTLYGRNQSLNKKEGDLVDAGDRIAQAGNTGGFSDTGVYFEIREKGKPINPTLWFVKT